MSMIGMYARVTPARLAELRSSPDDVWDVFDSEDALDVDKAWHAIHFTLTGDAWGGDWPEVAAVLGGEPLGPEGGYGPARVLTPEQVEAVSAALQAVLPSDLEQRLDFTAMGASGVYPAFVGGPEDVAYITTHYAALRRYFDEAESAGDAMLLAIA